MDVLTEFQALHANLVSFRRSSPPPPFNDEPWLPFSNSSRKGGVHIDGDKGSFVRLHLGVSWCIFFLSHDVFVLVLMYLFLWVVYVRGRHFALYFFNCFLFHMCYIDYWFILQGYSWYTSVILYFVKSRTLFCFTCIFHTCIFVFVECFRNI